MTPDELKSLLSNNSQSTFAYNLFHHVTTTKPSTHSKNEAKWMIQWPHADEDNDSVGKSIRDARLCAKHLRRCFPKYHPIHSTQGYRLKLIYDAKAFDQAQVKPNIVYVHAQDHNLQACYINSESLYQHISLNSIDSSGEIRKQLKDALSYLHPNDEKKIFEALKLPREALIISYSNTKKISDTDRAYRTLFFYQCTRNIILDAYQHTTELLCHKQALIPSNNIIYQKHKEHYDLLKNAFLNELETLETHYAEHKTISIILTLLYLESCLTPEEIENEYIHKDVIDTLHEFRKAKIKINVSILEIILLILGQCKAARVQVDKIPLELIIRIQQDFKKEGFKPKKINDFIQQQSNPMPASNQFSHEPNKEAGVSVENEKQPNSLTSRDSITLLRELLPDMDTDIDDSFEGTFDEEGFDVEKADQPSTSSSSFSLFANTSTPSHLSLKRLSETLDTTQETEDTPPTKLPRKCTFT